jgi:hypothetical protein
MKKITLFMLCIAIICFNNHLFSQWNVGGNVLPVGGGALGSNNNRPVIFETNNIERARLLNDQRLLGFSGLWHQLHRYILMLPQLQQIHYK